MTDIRPRTKFGFPAHEMFDADDRVTRVMARVYQHLRTVLDFSEPRDYSLQQVEHFTSTDAANLSQRYVRRLVEWGYLIEHPRLPGAKAKRYTLAWSVRVDLRTKRAS